MNNFNQSSTGVNVEIEIFRDNDLAQCYFSDNFILVKNRLLLFLDFGNFYPKFIVNSLNDLYKGTVRTDKIKEAKKMLYDYYTSQELDNELKDSDNIRVDLYDLLDNNFDSEMIINLVDKEFPFELVVVKGFSQSDFCTVIVPEMKDKYTVKNSVLSNLVYNSPLRVTINVNDKEFTNDIFDIDEYNDEIDEVKAKVKKSLISELTEIEYKEVIKVLGKFTEIEYK